MNTSAPIFKVLLSTCKLVLRIDSWVGTSSSLLTRLSKLSTLCCRWIRAGSIERRSVIPVPLCCITHSLRANGFRAPPCASIKYIIHIGITRLTGDYLVVKPFRLRINYNLQRLHTVIVLAQLITNVICFGVRFVSLP